MTDNKVSTKYKQLAIQENKKYLKLTRKYILYSILRCKTND